jgi:hypothetical protein
MDQNKKICLENDIKYINLKTASSNVPPYWGKVFEIQKLMSNNEYDYIFWLDTDVVFEPHDIARILMKLQMNKEINILSGIYAMANGAPAVIVDDSPEVLHENDSYTTASIEDLLVDGTKHQHGIVKVKCPGMGFVAFKKNVFERISYPWFENLKIDSPHFVDYDFEDVSLFKKLAKKDIFVYVDTETLIGHDKVSTIRL